MRIQRERNSVSFRAAKTARNPRRKCVLAPSAGDPSPSLRLRMTRELISAMSDHGSAPPIKYGMKYHGGPVRLSAFVAIRSAVSVTST